MPQTQEELRQQLQRLAKMLSIKSKLHPETVIHPRYQAALAETVDLQAKNELLPEELGKLGFTVQRALIL